MRGGWSTTNQWCICRVSKLSRFMANCSNSYAMLPCVCNTYNTACSISRSSEYQNCNDESCTADVVDWDSTTIWLLLPSWFLYDAWCTVLIFPSCFCCVSYLVILVGLVEESCFLLLLWLLLWFDNNTFECVLDVINTMTLPANLHRAAYLSCMMYVYTQPTSIIQVQWFTRQIYYTLFVYRNVERETNKYKWSFLRSLAFEPL